MTKHATAEPRMSSTPNCHDDGHVWGVYALIRDDGAMVVMCGRCGQTRAQVEAYEARKRQEVER